ncbi:hypothetical protein SAZ11_53640 [Streptomyces sp. FXJ1.4098]|nr:hypothetical protein [Streptomyces sp. FXJ1.4098]
MLAGIGHGTVRGCREPASGRRAAAARRRGIQRRVETVREAVVPGPQQGLGEPVEQLGLGVLLDRGERGSRGRAGGEGDVDAALDAAFLVQRQQFAQDLGEVLGAPAFQPQGADPAERPVDDMAEGERRIGCSRSTSSTRRCGCRCTWG